MKNSAIATGCSVNEAMVIHVYEKITQIERSPLRKMATETRDHTRPNRPAETNAMDCHTARNWNKAEPL